MMKYNYIIAAIETSDTFADSQASDVNKVMPIELAAVKVTGGRFHALSKNTAVACVAILSVCQMSSLTSMPDLPKNRRSEMG